MKKILIFIAIVIATMSLSSCSDGSGEVWITPREFEIKPSIITSAVGRINYSQEITFHFKSADVDINDYHKAPIHFRVIRDWSVTAKGNSGHNQDGGNVVINNIVVTLWPPMGHLEYYHGTLNQYGKIRNVYYSSELSGTCRIEAFITNIGDVATNLRLHSTATITMADRNWDEMVPENGCNSDGLQIWKLVGETTNHSDNHFGKREMIYSLVNLADDIATSYASTYPGDSYLQINDMSLPMGGLFDIRNISTVDYVNANYYDSNGGVHIVKYRGGWDPHYFAPSHFEHRVGINADVYPHFAVVYQSTIDYDLRNKMDDKHFPINDLTVHTTMGGTTLYVHHYHLRFNNN